MSTRRQRDWMDAWVFMQLATTTRAVTAQELHGLAGRHYSQQRIVGALRRLQRLGMVEALAPLKNNYRHHWQINQYELHALALAKLEANA